MKSEKDWVLIVVCVRKLALSKLFSSMFFGWSMIYDPFPHPHSSTYLLSYILDLFKLYTNTSNYLDMLLSSLFWYSLTLLQCSMVFQSLLVSLTYLLFHTLKALAKYFALFQFGLLILYCFWLLKYHYFLLM